MLNVGERAPDIDATTTSGQRFVASQADRPFVVVYFFPKAFTSDCKREAELFRDNYAELRLIGAEVVGISTDSLATQCKFAAELQVTFPLVADVDKKIAEAYGVLWPIIGVTHRVTFVLDRTTMQILARFKHELNADRHRDDVLLFLDALYQKRRAT